MCSVPDGYGSISSWYQCSLPDALARLGIGHLEGALVGPDALPLRLDRLRVVLLHRSSPGTKKPLAGEAVGSCAAARRVASWVR